VLGCALLLAPGGQGGVDLLGVGLSLVAGACYGVYTVCVKRLLGAGADPLSVLIGTVTIGALLLSPVFLTGAGAVFSPGGALLIFWLGPVATAGAYARG
jgi:DME family drug/metabolite transporter